MPAKHELYTSILFEQRVASSENDSLQHEETKE